MLPYHAFTDAHAPRDFRISKLIEFIEDEGLPAFLRKLGKDLQYEIDVLLGEETAFRRWSRILYSFDLSGRSFMPDGAPAQDIGREVSCRHEQERRQIPLVEGVPTFPEPQKRGLSNILGIDIRPEPGPDILDQRRCLVWNKTSSVPLDSGSPSRGNCTTLGMTHPCWRAVRAAGPAFRERMRKAN